MMRQFELVERVKSYDPSADEEAINRAYVFAMKAHGAQKRLSGDPYFSHPIEVAGILTRYKVDTATIVTALLHDTIEDTDATPEDIENLFGDRNRAPRRWRHQADANQLSKRSSQTGGEFPQVPARHVGRHTRVLLVKLADRLHNMRTLRYMKKPESRTASLLETMDIYAPLAERIGMDEIKTELEDLAFAEMNPDARNSVVRAGCSSARSRGAILVNIGSSELAEKMQEQH
jgi:guanosine-3',5'-bis(diphosphate) 3'-pyrophosphohydrolase